MNRRLAILPLSLTAGAAIATGAGFAAGAGSSQGQQHAVAVKQPALVTPFVAYGDHAIYDLIPGGNFAAKTAGWSMSTGAQVVANGSEASASGTRALSLSSGASATSGAFPGGDVHTVRFFAQNMGSTDSKLQVSATVDVNGVETQVPLGTVAGGSLAPTPVITLPESLQVQLTKSDAPLRVTVSSTGQNSHWLIKDVYVDPYHLCGGHDC